MSTANQAADAGDWRSRHRNMRTSPGLRGEKPDHGVLAPMDADALAAAVENPDHSEAGRAAAAAALRERGLKTEPWRVRVPGFIIAADLARAQTLFFGWGRAVRFWSGWAIYLIFGGLVAFAAIAPEREPADLVGKQSETFFGLVGLAMLLSMAVWYSSSALRRKPARILLLRKFNERGLAAPLERAIARELRPFGHIATLVRPAHQGRCVGLAVDRAPVDQQSSRGTLVRRRRAGAVHLADFRSVAHGTRHRPERARLPQAGADR